MYKDKLIKLLDVLDDSIARYLYYFICAKLHLEADK